MIAARRRNVVSLLAVKVLCWVLILAGLFVTTTAPTIVWMQFVEIPRIQRGFPRIERPWFIKYAPLELLFKEEKRG